jgi:hypothetical protein
MRGFATSADFEHSRRRYPSSGRQINDLKPSCVITDEISIEAYQTNLRAKVGSMLAKQFFGEWI